MQKWPEDVQNHNSACFMFVLNQSSKFGCKILQKNDQICNKFDLEFVGVVHAVRRLSLVCRG